MMKWFHFSFVPAAAFLAIPAAVAETTTTTIYTYNPDGAMTSILMTDGSGDKTQTLYTWDNFVPSVGSPATGTVRRGDGNLLVVRPLSDVEIAPASFAFDARGRLKAQTAGDVEQVYDYHADSVLRSSELSGDERRFYHRSGAYSRTTNIVETDGTASVTSARLGAGRYLNDGTEQTLFTPRKDMAGVFSGGTFEGRAYAPFGQPLSTAPKTDGYDLTDPPEGFTGEYTDPAWGGVYLRARWYEPSMAQFVSRDPRPHLNRFAYAAGNPIVNVDPSGMSAQRPGDHREAPWYDRGVAGFFAQLFLMPIVGPMEIAAHPKGFWHAISHDQNGIDFFLAAGVAMEGFSILAEEFGMIQSVRTINASYRIGLRRVFDVGLGIGQAAAAGYRRGSEHYNWTSFRYSLTQSVGTLLYTHYLGGIGYHPFAQTGDDILSEYRRMVASGEGDAIVFRERGPLGPSRPVTGGNLLFAGTSPAGEWRNLGLYHEAVVVVSDEGVQVNELGLHYQDGKTYGIRKTAMARTDSEVQNLLAQRGTNSRYLRAGNIGFFRPAMVEHAAPMSIVEDGLVLPNSFRYNFMRNNCHHYASAVIRELGN